MFFQLCFAFDVEKIVENNFVGMYLSHWLFKRRALIFSQFELIILSMIFVTKKILPVENNLILEVF
ncbi:hypothetical protein DK873_08905 [Lactobacillus melliventris]|uniref:Uncharacterized protein n=1 Tax=Lactobacillus melliventris TaxID=1218507 RepID=A0ABX5N2B0_9LACO|nr:hypothetical protein DK873_08905 [Lactobacillus melliventris]